MFRPSSRAGSLFESSTLAVSARARQLQAQGVDVANLAAGEPDFDTPDHVKEAAIAAIRAGQSKYTPSAGVPALRQAVVEDMRRRRGIQLSLDQVAIMSGAKQAIFNAMAVSLEDHDEVLVPVPYWVSYPAMAMASGARAIPVLTQDDMDLDTAALASAVTDKTRAILINTPCNPSGAVYSEQALLETIGLAEERDLLIFADEIYEQCVYGGRFPSITNHWERVKGRTVLINGVSKAYAMTGWRIGWVIGPPAWVDACVRLAGQTTSCPSSVSQAAALAALTGPDDAVQVMVEEFNRRRLTMVDRLNKIPGVFCHEPKGAFYAFPRTEGLYGRRHRGERIRGSADLSRLLLEVAHVATVPGEAFGDDRHVRLSYAVSLEEIERGLKRFERFVDELEPS